MDDEPLSFEGSDDEEPERRADASHDHASDDNDDDADLASNHLVSDDQDDNTRTSDSESDDDAHVERLRNDLASVPFEKLVEIREKMGTKEFERDVMGTRAMKRKVRGDQDANGDREEKALRFEKQKRANKNR